MKDAVTRKKIFVIPRADQFDQKWTADVQANGALLAKVDVGAEQLAATSESFLSWLLATSAGGRNDIAAVYMWVNRQQLNGWNFMSFCQTVRHTQNSSC
jgi:hypothetical protein